MKVTIVNKSDGTDVTFFVCAFFTGKRREGHQDVDAGAEDVHSAACLLVFI